MNHVSEIKDYVMRVNKIMTFILASGAISILVFTRLSVFTTYIPFIAFSIGSVLSTVLILKKISHRKIMDFLLISTFFCIGSAMIDMPRQAAIFSMVALCFPALYFSKEFTIIYSAGMSIVMIYLQFIKHAFGIMDFMIQIVIFLFSTMILFLITKWGSELIYHNKSIQTTTNG